MWFSVAVSVLVSLAIIAIGVMYLVVPRTAVQSFGLPLPEAGENVAWWLRLKGVRDVVSGLVLIVVLIWGDARLLGLTLLIEAMIPAGDMTLVLASKGSTARALGIHGLTAALMLLGGLIAMLSPAGLS